MSLKGSVKEHSVVTHAERGVDPREVKELWTEHKIVLIAYEAQFMYARREDKEEKRTPSASENELGSSSAKEATRRKRQDNRNSKMQTQSSFIFVDQTSEVEINARKEAIADARRWPRLNFLLASKQEDLEDLAKMVEILIEIKHPVIVKEFMDVYQFVVNQIISAPFTFEEEASRRQWQTTMVEGILELISDRSQTDHEAFFYFRSYMNSDMLSFRKLMLVTAYCLLAQRFNFSINQYYCDAFSHYEDEGHPEKRAKLENHEQ